MEIREPGLSYRERAAEEAIVSENVAADPVVATDPGVAATDPVVRAFAFSAGGFDSVMQLGVVHALLVTHAKAPDYIVGVSAGAINATALAEILQAGADNDPERQLAMQTDRLREFINAYHEVRGSLIDSIVPDSLEIFASAPLAPLESPLHFKEEREMREKANESKAGLIDVFNAIFGIRLSIATMTRLIRRVLGIIEAGEKPKWHRRVWAKFSNQRGLLATVWRRIVPIADLFGMLLWALIWSEHIRAVRFHIYPFSAGTLLSRWRTLRWIGARIKIAFKVVLTAVLLAVVTALWLGLWVPLVIPIKQIKRSKRLRGGKSTSAIWERILGYYSLRDGLANTDVLRQEIIRCFDQKYYGQVKADTAIPRALGHDTTLNETTHEQRKRVGDYSIRVPNIGVGIVAADIESGDLKILPPQIPIVDALTAAIALVPFFPATAIDAAAEAQYVRKKKYAPTGKQRGRAWYIDGSNISTQAIGPLVSYLRREIPKLEGLGKKRIDIYPVATLPIAKGAMPSAGEIEKGVVNTGIRALQLQQLRDAALERRLTALYTRAIGPGVMSKTIDGMTWVAVDIHPIELEEPAGLNALMLFSSDHGKTRARVLSTIAAGCRTTVEMVMRGDLRAATNAAVALAPEAKDQKLIAEGGAVLCRMALRRRLGTNKALPGTAAPNVPGIDDVCQHCSFYLPNENALEQSAAALASRVTKDVPDWPMREQAPKPPPVVEVGKPREEKESPFPELPVRSMLFGGGVFRGVCQVGVLNAANELQMEPHVVAGASVGSIIAAMIARVFRTPRKDRPLRIGRLAATFLAIDRLVLTDRMADFVRRLTLRAGHTAFSPYDFDRVFRRFDEDGALKFGKRARRTAAGIERLLYISPFELGLLAQQLREDHRDAAGVDLLEDVQDFLRRGGVGEEILGAEPLRLLIELHVLDDVKGDVRDVLLSYFSEGDNPLQFFATTTDVTKGELRLLRSDDKEHEPSLLFSLLASSAFPVVFRPRTSWEVFRRTNESTQFVDGGIMDNLPLYAVAEHLNRVLTKPADRRPAAPHLLFTASLETGRQPMKAGGWDVEQTRRSWRLLSKRAKTFTYNRKIDAYARAQRDLRRLAEAPDAPKGAPLLDLEIVAVKPKWLCGTFGFHPMLGFKRWKQAASIAHGCASTFGTMVAHETSNPGRMAAWNIKLEDIDDKAIQLVEKPRSEREPGFVEHDIVLVPLGGKVKEEKGTCWFRKTAPCPFSRQATQGVRWAPADDLNEKYMEELGQIYTACGLKGNHTLERS